MDVVSILGELELEVKRCDECRFSMSIFAIMADCRWAKGQMVADLEASGVSLFVSAPRGEGFASGVLLSMWYPTYQASSSAASSSNRPIECCFLAKRPI